jgi:hypothetical protein
MEVRMNDKLRENRLRRLAAREGYVLRKSRARERRLEDRQEYMLVDASTNIPVRGSYYDADLDEIAEFLAG